MTIEELKAKVYDLLMVIENANKELQRTNAEILSFKAEEAKK